MVSLKRFVNVSEKAVQVEETAAVPQTESEKILYKCRKLSVGVGVGRQFDAARAAESDAAAAAGAESQRSSVFVQIKEEDERGGEESEESRQKAARRENRLVGDYDLAEILGTYFIS